jgi:hypothetical protein
MADLLADQMHPPWFHAHRREHRDDHRLGHQDYQDLRRH